MAFWKRLEVTIVFRPTTRSQGRKWPFKRSVCWICIVSERFIDRGVAEHDVIESLDAVEESPAGAAEKARDEGHGDAGQGPVRGEEEEDADAEASVDVFTTGLRSNLTWTLINWLTHRTELRQRPAWLAALIKAIAQICLPNNGIVAYRYHVNRADISVIRPLRFQNFVIMILIF